MRNFGRGALYTIYCPPWRYKNVPRPKKSVLVEEHEEGHRILYPEVHDMPTCENRTPTPSRIIEITPNSRMEMGIDFDGLCRWLAKVCSRK